MNERTDSNTTPADDWLERTLRADAAEFRDSYLADDGFSARIAAALPAPAAALPSWRKPAVVALWTLTAVGALMAAPGAFVDVAFESLRLIARHSISVTDVASALLALGAASWAGAAYALRRDD